MIRYFRVPPTTHAETGNDLGVPSVVTRNQGYTPDAAGLIAVTDPEDAEAFAAHQGWIEVVGATELPAPPPTVSVTVSETAPTSSTAESGGIA